jgi:hypothetical protein
MPLTELIERWFEEELGGSLLLPDGWYGRPYDNQHALTSVVESGNAITLVLDQKLTLRFEGLKFVEPRKGELVFGPFAKLRFDWESFGSSGQRGTKEYQSGEVRIVGLAG